MIDWLARHANERTSSRISRFDGLNAETSAQSTVTVEGYQQNGMFGEGSERCKIFKVKSHESILEQSKKNVIRDSSPRAARINSCIYNSQS